MYKIPKINKVKKKLFIKMFKLWSKNLLSVGNKESQTSVKDANLPKAEVWRPKTIAEQNAPNHATKYWKAFSFTWRDWFKEENNTLKPEVKVFKTSTENLQVDTANLPEIRKLNPY